VENKRLSEALTFVKQLQEQRQEPPKVKTKRQQLGYQRKGRKPPGRPGVSSSLSWQTERSVFRRGQVARLRLTLDGRCIGRLTHRSRAVQRSVVVTVESDLQQVRSERGD